jgi:2,4-dienoyl-CoA reductase-like NADH-dependent reductase (Old Yellow Enzyme family)
MPHLFEPLTLRGITLRNRIGVSPMCQYSSSDGFANDWHLVHLGARAVGGAGLIIAEATAVTPQGRITPGCAGIWSDAHIEPLQRITRFIREQGVVPGIQLAHAGRKAGASIPWEGDAGLSDEDGGWPTIAPSALAFGGPLRRVPRAASPQDIADVQAAFVAAAQRAVAAGYELVEIHAAHGYLHHSFLSPLTNARTDAYGGSFENRIRFTVETVRQVRAALPDHLPLAVRLSCTDWAEGGWSLEDSVALAQRLKAEGADLVDCSSGGAVRGVRIPVGAGYQVPFAEAVRQRAGVASAAVGMITSAAHADEVIRNGRADLVLLGREMLRNPYWPLEAARELGHRDAVPVPPQYLRAF